MSDHAGEPTSSTTRRPRGRSPSYPAIDLRTAIDRARKLWEKERQHPTPVATAVRHWGYKAMSGPASTTLAALKKFGLTEDEGKGQHRRTRLTDLAVDILGNPDERARREAIRRAALNPDIHRELWETYGSGLPSEENLQWELVREMGFTETGAGEFIREYRDTIAFAGLDTDGDASTIHDGHGDADDAKDGQDGRTDEGGGTSTPERQKGRRVNEAAATYTIPLAGGRSILVEGEFPVAEQDWQQFLVVLNAMKPGLVRNEDTAQ